MVVQSSSSTVVAPETRGRMHYDVPAHQPTRSPDVIWFLLPRGGIPVVVVVVVPSTTLVVEGSSIIFLSRVST